MALKISIVENDPKGWERFASLRAAYRLTTYASGEEVLRMVSNPPDLALVNFYLPAMDGFECVRKLKTALPALPVLMYASDWKAENIHGHMDNDLIFSAAHAGANGYLPRALPQKEMLKAIGQ